MRVARTWLAPSLLAAGVWSVYLATLAPTMTWRNGGSDGAELAAAAWVWGVAHPPGYPLYVAVARVFQTLPLGDVAYRTALLSAVSATATAVLVLLVVRALSEQRTWWRDAAGAFAGASFGFASLPWSQAVVAEVYTFGAALLGALLLAVTRWLQRPERGRTLVVSACLAALVAHQPTFVVLYPALGALGWRLHLPRRDWLLAFALQAAVPALFLTLWLRAAAGPPLSWGDPTTPERWLAHVTAADYRAYFLARPLPDELARVPSVAALLARQVGWLGVALAAVGCAWLWGQQRGFALFLVGVVAFCVGFTALYNVEDGQVYLLPAVLGLAVTAGLGAGWLLDSAHGSSRLVAIALLAASPLWQVGAAWSEVDASHDRQARERPESLLRAAPAGAVLRSREESYTFALWYLQSVEGLRPDVAIVDDRLLALPWYRAQVLRRYPQLEGSGIAE